ncbi:MAG: hypothetical protein ACTH31_05815 [Pseudoclavibacter sp.]
MNRWAKALLAGGATLIVAGGVLWFLGTAIPLAVGLGAVLGVGMGLMTLPGAAQKLETVRVEPTTTDGYLAASRESADAMSKQMNRLTSRALWASSGLDERIAEMLGGIRTLAVTPALAGRERADGDVQTLYRLATDYLPTLVNLAIENDRMHASFRGSGARESVEQNVAALDEQSAILREALEQIEQDVVRGVSRDAAQHSAFLHSRFAQARTPAILDLGTPVTAASLNRAPPYAATNAAEDHRASGRSGQNGVSA